GPELGEVGGLVLVPVPQVVQVEGGGPIVRGGPLPAAASTSRYDRDHPLPSPQRRPQPSRDHRATSLRAPNRCVRWNTSSSPNRCAPRATLCRRCKPPTP